MLLEVILKDNKELVRETLRCLNNISGIKYHHRDLPVEGEYETKYSDNFYSTITITNKGGKFELLITGDTQLLKVGKLSTGVRAVVEILDSMPEDSIEVLVKNGYEDLSTPVYNEDDSKKAAYLYAMSPLLYFVLSASRDVETFKTRFHALTNIELEVAQNRFHYLESLSIYEDIFIDPIDYMAQSRGKLKYYIQPGDELMLLNPTEDIMPIDGYDAAWDDICCDTLPSEAKAAYIDALRINTEATNLSIVLTLLYKLKGMYVESRGDWDALDRIRASTPAEYVDTYMDINSLEDVDTSIKFLDNGIHAIKGKLNESLISRVYLFKN